MKKSPDSQVAGSEGPQGERHSVTTDPGTVLVHYLDELLAPATPPLQAAAAWHEPILCQLIEAGGIMLAAPASSLSLVPCMPLHPLAGSTPRWIAGYGVYWGETLVVVDLAALIGEGQVSRSEQVPAGTLLLLGGTNVALRPQRMLATAALDPARICWRTARTSRVWLMGVCTDPPCALLDVAALATAAVAAAGMDCAICRSERAQRQ